MSSDSSAEPNHRPGPQDRAPEPIPGGYDLRMSDDGPVIEKRPMSAVAAASPDVPLKSHQDPQQILQLLQCDVCNRILKQPLSLPCGRILCRHCLPPIHERKNISYPNQPGRRQGFVCPLKRCKGKEHSLADCSLDITLVNVLAVFETVLASEPATPTKHPSDNQNLAQAGGCNTSRAPEFAISSSVLRSAYSLVKQGLLPNQRSSSTVTSQDPGVRANDERLLALLLEKVHSELSCHVCYCLYYLPMTTSCGHTFCRRCLERVRGYSNLCPLCRRPLSTCLGVAGEDRNSRLESLLSTMYSEETSTRRAQTDNSLPDKEQAVPIFACAITFPHLPMFLHIFEPRYRLMLQRVIEDGTRSFGMVPIRRGSRPSEDGDFDAPFHRYGTMLHVTNLQALPDGRSLVETAGMSRFRIVSYSWQDGYPVAKVERFEDIPFAEEEVIEAAERTLGISPGSLPQGDLASSSTQALYQQGLEFVELMRNEPGGFFAGKLLNIYGQPPQDPALFPFWMATLMPVNERDKYLILVSASARERLKLVVTWIRRIERQNWRVRGVVRRFLNTTAPVALALTTVYICLICVQGPGNQPAGISETWFYLITAITTMMAVAAVFSLSPQVVNANVVFRT